MAGRGRGRGRGRSGPGMSAPQDEDGNVIVASVVTAPPAYPPDVLERIQALPPPPAPPYDLVTDSDTLLPFSALQAQQAGKNPASPSLQEVMSLDPTYFPSELYSARQRSVSMNARVNKVYNASTVDMENRILAWSSREEKAARVPDSDAAADGAEEAEEMDAEEEELDDEDDDYAQGEVFDDDEDDFDDSKYNDDEAAF